MAPYTWGENLPNDKCGHDSKTEPEQSLHLNGAWRLARNVVYYTTYPIDLIHDPSTNSLQELAVEREPIRRHKIRGFHRSQRDDLLMHTLISHHTHGLDRQECGKGLADLAVQTRRADLFDEDMVGLTSDGHLGIRNFAKDTDSNAWAGKRVAPDELLGNTEFSSESADFVFEELPKRLDKLEVHPRE